MCLVAPCCYNWRSASIAPNRGCRAGSIQVGRQGRPRHRRWSRPRSRHGARACCRGSERDDRRAHPGAAGSHGAGDPRRGRHGHLVQRGHDRLRTGERDGRGMRARVRRPRRLLRQCRHGRRRRRRVLGVARLGVRGGARQQPQIRVLHLPCRLEGDGGEREGWHTDHAVVRGRLPRQQALGLRHGEGRRAVADEGALGRPRAAQDPRELHLAGHRRPA